MSWLLLVTLALAETADTGPMPPPHGDDADDDGWPDSVDCRADNPTVFPGAPEVCNGLDDDCNGEVDDQDEICGDRSDNDCDGVADESCGLCNAPVDTGPSGALVLIPLALLGLGAWRRL